MKKSRTASRKLLVNQQRVTLLELLDRLLDKGVVVKGEIILSVAEIDLIYLNLGLLLSSVKTVKKARGIGGSSPSFFTGESGEANKDFFKEENPNIEWVETSVKPFNGERTNLPACPLRRSVSEASKAGIMPRTNIDPDNVEKGLTKLVLTLIELLRRLMEKQAIRRMEAGFLTVSEVERMGVAFQRLEERMEYIKHAFHLKDKDLNLDLGPIGELM